DLDITVDDIPLDNYGGFVGSSAGTTFVSVYASGKLEATVGENSEAENVGGLIGSSEQTLLIDGFSAKEITLLGAEIEDVGAVLGQNSWGTTMLNTFYDEVLADMDWCVGYDQDEQQYDCTGIDEAGYFIDNNENPPLDMWNWD